MKAAFDVSKLTVFCVEVYANEESEVSDKDPLSNVSEKNVSEKLGEIVYGTSRFRNAKKMASKRTATKIIEQMLQNPQITASKIARNLGITQDSRT